MLKSSVLFVLTALLAVACSTGGTKDRAQRLASACLDAVRMEQAAMAAKTSLTGSQATADSLFLAAIKSSPECVSGYVATGQGDCAALLESFLAAMDKEKIQPRPDDPAAVLGGLLKGRVTRNPQLLDGYLAVFQMCMEIERDGTVLQDLMPFVVALGCPMTYRDLGLAGVPDAETLGAEAAAKVGEVPYAKTPEDFVMPLVKIDSWGSKFSGQVTADTLAARLMAEPWFEPLRPGLERMSWTRIGFLGDSHMDKRHWSTAAPFPEIVRGVLKVVKPEAVVINAGVGGDDSGEALARMDTDIIAKNPQIVFISLGGNDSRHWGGSPTPKVSPEQFVLNFTEMANRLKAIGSQVVLMEPPHCPEHSGADLETFTAICDSLRLLPERLGAGWLGWTQEQTEADPKTIFARDMIHMNPNGHLTEARKVLEYMATRQ